MCGLPVAIQEFVVYRDPTGCMTVFYFSPFEVRDDSNPSGDGLPHLSRIKLGGAATIVVERQEEGDIQSIQHPVYFISEVLSESKIWYPQVQKILYAVLITS